MTATGREPCYRRSAGLLWRQTLDRVVVLVPGTEELLELPGTGLALWSCLAAPRSLTDIVTSLAETFEVPESTVRADIRPVLDELVVRSLVEVR